MQAVHISNLLIGPHHAAKHRHHTFSNLIFLFFSAERRKENLITFPRRRCLAFLSQAPPSIHLLHYSYSSWSPPLSVGFSSLKHRIDEFLSSLSPPNCSNWWNNPNTFSALKAVHMRCPHRLHSSGEAVPLLWPESTPLSHTPPQLCCSCHLHHSWEHGRQCPPFWIPSPFYEILMSFFPFLI